MPAGMTSANITHAASACDRTDETTTISRGNQIFLISEALSTIDVVPLIDRRLEEREHREPAEHEQRIVLHRRRAPEHAEEERVDARHQQRLEIRPDDAERRALVALAHLAPQQAGEELAVRGSPGQSARQSRSAVYESTHVARSYRVRPVSPASDPASLRRSSASGGRAPRARRPARRAPGAAPDRAARSAAPGTPAQTSHGGIAAVSTAPAPRTAPTPRLEPGIITELAPRNARWSTIEMPVYDLAPLGRRDRAHRRVELFRPGQDAAPLRHARVVAEPRAAAREDRAEATRRGRGGRSRRRGRPRCA